MDKTAGKITNELYWEYYEIHVHLKGRKINAYLSGDNKVVFFQSEANWFYTAAEAYRTIKTLPKGIGLFTVEYVREYLDVPPPPGPCPELIKQVLKEIPSPYSITAVAWYEGADVRNEPVGTAIPMSRSTYYRHRRKLLEYGIDISKKSNVFVIRYRWDQIRQR